MPCTFIALNNYIPLFFEDAEDFIESLSDKDKAKILAEIKMLETHFDLVYTKPLRGSIRELLVRHYRLLFFIHNQTIYFTHGFVKKSQKTPVREIEKAELIYKQLKKLN